MRRPQVTKHIVNEIQNLAHFVYNQYLASLPRPLTVEAHVEDEESDVEWSAFSALLMADLVKPSLTINDLNTEEKKLYDNFWQGFQSGAKVNKHTPAWQNAQADRSAKL